jgi:hypothetical protein
MPMTNSNTDYTVIDMRTHLSRSALVQDPYDSSRWIKDDEWYERQKTIYSALYRFFREHGLLKDVLQETAIEDLIVKYSDFTDEGKRFLKSGGMDNWLASFDRRSSDTPVEDTSLLARHLRKLRMVN